MTSTAAHRTRHCTVPARRWLFGAILSIIVAHAESAAGACEDTDNGNTDSYGDDCADYTSNADSCSGSSCWCSRSYTWDTSYFSGATMCCACGGGAAVVPSPSPPPPPSPSPPPACLDTDHGALDAYNTGCSVYYDSTHWCGTSYDDWDFTANSMCCACGGGTTAGASPSPPPPSPSPPPPPPPPSPPPPTPSLPPPTPPPMSENLLIDPYEREAWDVQADGGNGCLFSGNVIYTSYAVSRAPSPGPATAALPARNRPSLNVSMHPLT